MVGRQGEAKGDVATVKSKQPYLYDRVDVNILSIENQRVQRDNEPHHIRLRRHKNYNDLLLRQSLMMVQMAEQLAQRRLGVLQHEITERRNSEKKKKGKD
jgi:hypothetical protein